MNTKKTLMALRRSRQERVWAEVGGSDALRRCSARQYQHEREAHEEKNQTPRVRGTKSS